MSQVKYLSIFSHNYESILYVCLKYIIHLYVLLKMYIVLVAQALNLHKLCFAKYLIFHTFSLSINFLDLSTLLCIQLMHHSNSQVFPNLHLPYVLDLVLMDQQLGCLQLSATTYAVRNFCRISILSVMVLTKLWRQWQWALQNCCPLYPSTSDTQQFLYFHPSTIHLSNYCQSGKRKVIS